MYFKVILSQLNFLKASQYSKIYDTYEIPILYTKK